MKVLVTGGGTGGHIYPALAIIDKLKKENNEVDILYVGTKKGLESDIVPKEGIDFRTIRVQGFRRKISLDTLKSIFELLKGINDSRKVIKDFKPNLVIGTGGYVCGPIVLIASLKKIPTLVHEQNAFPGATNRILSKYVTKIACSFEEAINRFKNPKKVVLTGNPIKEELLKLNIENIFNKENMKHDKKILLSFGGSGGQNSLNKIMINFINNHYDGSFQIVHVTGKKFYKDFLEKCKVENEDIKILEYCYNLTDYMGISDLIISSAGAMTISEITALGKPSIIIPKRNTAENHQEYNGRALENQKAAVLILEKDIKDEIVEKNIIELLNDNDKLENMGKNSYNVGIRDSNDRIYNLISEIIK